MDKIYVLKKDMMIHGPYNMQSIKKFKLRNTDKVWYEGLNDWTPVTQLDAFQKEIKDRLERKETFFGKVFSFLK